MSDKRGENRVPLHERVSLEIIAETAPGEVSTLITNCRTVDISAGGLRLLIDHVVAVGTVMNMTVVVDEGQRQFELSAEVRWLKPSPEPGWFLAGFEIYDTDTSDSAAWRYFLQRQK